MAQRKRFYCTNQNRRCSTHSMEEAKKVKKGEWLIDTEVRQERRGRVWVSSLVCVSSNHPDRQDGSKPPFFWPDRSVTKTCPLINTSWCFLCIFKALNSRFLRQILILTVVFVANASSNFCLFPTLSTSIAQKMTFNTSVHLIWDTLRF